ncbi:hypothetical protein D9M68_510700 [compost metagenome]
MPGVVAGAAGAAAADDPVPVPVPALSLFSSLMFFVSSATRLLLSCAWRACATFSSAARAAALPCDTVSLSGALAAALRSSTLACSLPEAWRLAAATLVVGAFSARRWR